jgi:hypothetical protein
VCRRGQPLELIVLKWARRSPRRHTAISVQPAGHTLQIPITHELLGLCMGCGEGHSKLVIPYVILVGFARDYRMHLIFEKSGIRMYLTVLPILIRPG